MKIWDKLFSIVEFAYLIIFVVTIIILTKLPFTSDALILLLGSGVMTIYCRLVNIEAKFKELKK